MIMSLPFDQTDWALPDRGVRRSWTALHQMPRAWLSLDGLWRRTGSDAGVPPQLLLSFLIQDAGDRFRFQRIVAARGPG